MHYIIFLSIFESTCTLKHAHETFILLIVLKNCNILRFMIYMYLLILAILVAFYFLSNFCRALHGGQINLVHFYVTIYIRLYHGGDNFVLIWNLFSPVPFKNIYFITTYNNNFN